MKIAVLNLPAMRPTMPPYAIGIISNILNEIENIDCDVYDINLLFWDSIFSKNYNIKADIISEYYNLDSKIDIVSAKEMIKKPTTSFQDYNMAMERIQKQMLLYSELFEVKISYGRVELPENAYNIEDLDRLSRDDTRNIYYKIISDYIHILKEKQYEVVFISIMCKEQLLSCLTLANLIKKYNDDLPIVIGGSFVDRFREKFNNDIIQGLFTDILFGRAEECIPKFLNKKYNMGLKIPLKRIHEVEFETFYGSLNIKDYYNMTNIMPIMASRFCYYHNCKFCDNAYNYEDMKRIEVSAEEIVKQMKEYYKKYGITTFYFIDDCLSPLFVEQLSNILCKEKDFSWFANMRFSEKMIHKEYVELLANSGCKQLFLGMESYSDNELLRMRKGIKVDWIIPTIQLLKQYGISVYISVMLGFPGQEDSDYEKTKNFLFENAEYLDMIDINIFTQTPVYNKRNKEVINKEEKMSFMNCNKNFRDKVTEKIINDRYSELFNWVSKNNKLATYWNRNFYLTDYSYEGR